jgi:hypothetical protein
MEDWRRRLRETGTPTPRDRGADAARPGRRRRESGAPATRVRRTGGPALAAGALYADLRTASDPHIDPPCHGCAPRIARCSGMAGQTGVRIGQATT